MPVALDPNETYSYVMSTDRLKPEAERPTLIFYFPTGRETRQIALAFDDAMAKSRSVDEWMDMRFDALRPILAGWKNFRDRKGNPVPFDRDMLDTVLSDTDLTELESRLLKEMSFEEQAKKKSAFSALSNSAGCAPNAAAGNAGLQPPPSRSKSNASSATDKPAAGASHAEEPGITD
jgi:hypothetical protein